MDTYGQLVISVRIVQGLRSREVPLTRIPCNAEEAQDLVDQWAKNNQHINPDSADFKFMPNPTVLLPRI